LAEGGVRGGHMRGISYGLGSGMNGEEVSGIIASDPC
jgi:hypothetical protein